MRMMREKRDRGGETIKKEKIERTSHRVQIPRSVLLLEVADRDGQDQKHENPNNFRSHVCVCVCAARGTSRKSCQFKLSVSQVPD